MDQHVDVLTSRLNSEVARDLRLTKDTKSKPMVWPRPKNPDAELDKALRELGDDLLKQEIPERLLRVLRAARDDKKDKRQES